MNNKTRLVIILIFLFSTLTFGGHCQSQFLRKNPKIERYVKREQRKAELRGEIQLSGAFALYPMIVRWSEEFRKIHPRVKIDISAGGAGKGITDALARVVDLGMVSREVHKAELDKGAFVITVAKDAVVATVNSSNPLISQIRGRGLKRQKAHELWVDGTIKTWGQLLSTTSTVRVHSYTRSDACGAAETWGAWLGVRQEDIEGTAVFGDPGLCSVIQRDKIGIGFNNVAYAYNLKTKLPYRNIAVVPLDLDNNGRIDPQENFYNNVTELMSAIADGRYPSPPSRDLYLVCNGKPDKPEVVEFLFYILTEGQRYTLETGFVPLTETVIEEQLSKIL